ncbi:MAG: sulfite exporter TauE/SafE family protein [Planctomycetes bacterium]|nr:sulfite exporter TauE/SafE family protein [Planctomycetota bacterium]
MHFDAPPGTLAAVAAVFLASGMLQGASGFGFGIASMSMLPYLLPPKTAAVVVAALAPVMSAQILLSLRKHANWRKITPLCITYILLGLPLGYLLFGYADDRLLGQILGISLVLGCGGLWIFSGDRTYRLPGWTTVPAGTLSGILSGSANIGGPPVVIYMWLQDVTKEEASASLQAYFTVANVTKFAGLVVLGIKGAPGYEQVTASNCLLGFICWPAVAVGCWLGLKLFHRIDAAKLRKIAYALVILSGLVMLVKSIVVKTA